jgi:glucose-1-phosphate thymidylyltransferase
VKGLILSGGSGTRLRPITHTSAKQLVPVANKPILFYGIEDMAAAGIRDIGIIVGETAAEIRAAVGDGSRWGVDVTYLPQDHPRGLAHCVLVARDFLGEDDFVMYLGDNLLRQGITEFVEAFERDRRAAAAPTLHEAPRVPSAQILLTRVQDPERFGVAALDEHGDVARLVEKPEIPPSDLALVGVYLFDPSIHEAVASISPSTRGELEITDAIQWLIDHGHKVRHEVLDGWWKDTGKLEPLLEGNRLVLETIDTSIEGVVDDASRIEGRVVIQKGAEVINSHIRGPAIIGERTRIVDSYVGPYTSVYYDCVVQSTELEHSIILEESQILDLPRVIDSLVGKKVVARRSDARPSAIRLMLGDHSKIEVV